MSCVFLAGCEFRHEFSNTVLEIVDVASGMPATDVEVRASARIARYFVQSGDDGMEGLAPPDANGQTYVLMQRDQGVMGQLMVEVRRGATVHQFRLPNVAGAETKDGTFSVRVVAADAPPPPLPVPEPVIGTNPPAIRIDGYVGVFRVCNNESGYIEWSIGSGTEHYLATVILGVVPPGFYDSTFEITDEGPESRACLLAADYPPIGSGYTTFVREPFSNTWNRGGSYCVDIDGASVMCP
jgi:hypothetical protein